MHWWMLTALAVPCLIGVAVQRVIGFRVANDPAGYFGRIFPIGFLVLSVVLFLLMAMGIAVNNLVAPYLILGASIAMLFIPRQTTEHLSVTTHSRWTWLAITVLIVGAIGIIDNGASQWRTPVHTDDDASIWTLKAKVLHRAGQFDRALGEELRTRPSLHHQDYPLFNPLIQVWMLSTSSGQAEGALRIPTMLWALSLLLLLYSACRRHVSAPIASMIALMVVSAGIFQQSTTGTKSDVIVIVGLLGFIDFAWRCHRDASLRNICAMALFGGVLVWSKNEGLMLILGATLGFATTRLWTRAFLLRKAALLLLIPCLIIVGQVAFNSQFDLRNDLLTGGEGKDTRPLHRILVENTPEKLPTIASTFLEIGTGLRVGDERERLPMDRMTVLLRSNGIFLLAIFLLLLFPKHLLSGPVRAVTLCAVLSTAGFAVVYVISFEPLLWHLYTSAPRVLFHLSGPIALIIATAAGHIHTSLFPVKSDTQVDS